MNNPLLKKLLPHFIAVIVFLIVSVLFCKPVLEGNVLNQHDIIGWKGMAQNSFEYKEKNGHFPLWNPNLFSGMPNYQVAMQGKSVLPDMVKVFSLGLPKPINFFFLAALCFYILCLVLRLRPVIGILGGLAFAFATYNPIIIGAGHESKMWAIAFTPLLLAGLIATFEKRYWLGLALSTYAIYQQIGVNHMQITYYAFLIALAIGICYLITWIKNGEWKHIGIVAAITLLASGIGLAGSALTLMTTSEYTKYTMRGGKDLEINGDSVTATKTKGLDTGYAFRYSLGKAETAVMMMPNAFGSSSGEGLSEDSKVVSKLTDRGVPENNAIQIATGLPKYWGGIVEGTSGPPYLGVIICYLALLGFILYKNPLRWGLLAVSVLGIMMAWGKYLPGFNTFLFNNLPLYNKFRAPSMSLVINQVTFALMAVLALQFILFREKSKELLKTDLKKVLIATGGLIVVLLLIFFGMDYSAPIDQQVMSYKFDNSGSDEINRLIVSGLKADRKAIFSGQLLRSIGFIILVLALLYSFMKNWIKPSVVVIALLVVSSIDLFVIGKKYLSEDFYVSKDELESRNFLPSAIDQQILSDKDPNYRVFNLAGDTYNESRTSYFHKSVGGYHPAKLRIYQDVIEKYLSNRPSPGVLNMLNTKYFIVRDQQTNQESLLPNTDAFGPCWLVKNVKLVNDRVSAFNEIGTVNLKDTAVVENTFSKIVVQPQWDSASTLKMTKFDNDAIEYEANCNGPQFAVFSEIYYPIGWNAYLDGKKVDYCNVNYILRGMSIPAGKHSIKFVFEPASVKKGTSIMFLASIAVLLIFVGGLFMAWRQNRQMS
jgi:hypothetical protein